MVTKKETKTKVPKEKKVAKPAEPLASGESQPEGIVPGNLEVASPIQTFEGRKVVSVVDAEVNGVPVKKVNLEDRSSTIISVELFNKLTN